jgi:glycerophosphoryl diester phosphodiesterase
MKDRAIISSYNAKANSSLWTYTWIIIWRDTFDVGDIPLLYNANHQYFMTPYTNITWNIVQEIEDMGKRLITYTVNTTGELEQLYNQWVRMVMTDNIPLMKEWAENHLSK